MDTLFQLLTSGTFRSEHGTRVARSLQIFSRTFCRLMTSEILLHAYFEYFSDIVV